MPGPRWIEAQTATVRGYFEREGASGCIAREPSLSARGIYAVKQKAFQLGLKEPRPHNGLIELFTATEVDEIVRLREQERLSFKAIGDRFGRCESTASNAYVKAACIRRGNRPAARDHAGALLPAEIERLRAMLRKGMRGTEIQLLMGISASTVSNERRRYAADLKARGKRPLPPPGGGNRYSGAKLSRADRSAVEALFMQGLGAKRITALTGVSNTTCGRIRNRLIKRLARKGECLPGCDLKGVRHVQTGSARFVPPVAAAEVRRLLMEGVSHVRAGLLAGVGDCTAYRIRGELKAELEARGEALPPTRQVGRGQAAATRWLPPGARWVYCYRQLAAEHGEEQARLIIRDGLAAIAAFPRLCARLVAERRRADNSFEAQLARVRAGAAVVPRLQVHRADPSYTLGGIASAAIA